MLTKTDLSQIRQVVRGEIHEETDPRFRSIDLRFNKLDKKLDLVTRVLDHEHIRAMKRIERIEDHFNLPKPLFA